MIRYSFTKKIPNPNQKEEVEDLLFNKDFLKVLLLATNYYIQGYHGDYAFTVTEEGKIKVITITVY